MKKLESHLSSLDSGSLDARLLRDAIAEIETLRAKLATKECEVNACAELAAARERDRDEARAKLAAAEALTDINVAQSDADYKLPCHPLKGQPQCRKGTKMRTSKEFSEWMRVLNEDVI